MKKTELYEIMEELANILGYEGMADELAMAMDVQELESNLRFIDRMNETNLFYDGAWVSEVQDWTGRVLYTFEFEEYGEACEREAILKREEIASEQAKQDWVDKEQCIKDSYDNIEALEDAILDDLYVVSYNKQGESIPVNFG